MSTPTPATRQCGLCEQDQDDASYLCDGCTRATADRLGRMPALYDALGPYLAPGAGGDDGPRARAVNPGLPVTESVLSLRAGGGIVGVLEDWRAAMQADRGWGPPAITGDIPQRVLAAARGLQYNVDWIASAWPQAGTFAAEIRALVGDILTVVHPADPAERGHRVGHCPTQVDGVLCGAVLTRRSGERSISCRWCGATYPPATWPALAAAQTEVEMADAA